MQMNENIIEVKDVSMKFNLQKERVDSLKEYFIKKVKGQIHSEEFLALNNISFNVNKGESIGILGLNGSGKSTLLKIISGILKPTSGEVNVFGSIAPLIELGAGFDPDLTARENVYLNGAVLGYPKSFMEDKLDEIITFAELEQFIDVPIKNFSSGMVARLGFSIATINKPDILIVDEILSVGDFKFKEKCEARMAEIMCSGTTVILVTHSIEEIKRICNRAIWIERGKIVEIGESELVCNRYSGQ